jgi:hypothetical protein
MPAQTAIHGFLENTGKYSTCQAPPKHKPKVNVSALFLENCDLLTTKSPWPNQP